jgi:hypothetical protein
MRALMLGNGVSGSNQRAAARRTGLLFAIQVGRFRFGNVRRATGVWEMMGRRTVKRLSHGTKHV